ncbi:sulfatase [Treponema parvum]|uniref:Sulfatase n=1 Tax=Treponema parvum TaxID=138851 RepID=A0A975F2F3_9SPIR|nr:sulfatase [Treponema parvum]QTQ13158.1 sulfatase [Treponema parvum]
MKAILVLMDSLNRNYLTCYNDKSQVLSPNISAFSKEACVFDRHFISSAPCMPARHDLLTGRPDFLERCWGPVEAYDITIPDLLKKNGIFCHIVTDHCHYMDRGGENYLQEYSTWDYIRGQEYDPWISTVSAPTVGEHYGKVFTQYERNRTAFVKETDYPTPRTFMAACDWLEKNKDEDDYFLQVEVFDPHEPFETPQKYLDAYDDTYSGPRFNCSSYDEVTEPPEAIEHLKKRYSACITMADHWFGKLITKLKDLGLYDETLIILTTDHGHLLGEHGFTGKNFMHGYNQLSNIPFMMKKPKGEGAKSRISNLSQTIDIPATLLDYFNVPAPKTMLGTSLLGLEKAKTRKEIIYGWFGGAVNVFDGKHTYFKASVREDNRPLYNYCSMPMTLLKFMGQTKRDEIEMGRFLEYTDFPVYKIPAYFPIGHFKSTKFIRESLLFDYENDWEQNFPLKDDKLEAEMQKKLVRLMKWACAPADQYIRLGLPIKE